MSPNRHRHDASVSGGSEGMGAGTIAYCPGAAIHAYSSGPARKLGSKVSVLDPLARDARQCLRDQAEAVAAVATRLEDGAFGSAVRLLHSIEGHVLVTGIGKSGLVGQKIAATLASTGTPSFFLHAAEAFHGDLGMITSRDAIVLISYSGETDEVVRLMPHLQARGVPTVALVGNLESSLAQAANVALDVAVEREVCPNNLAPTSSTLVAMAMGDALAVSLIKMRGFDSHDFARLHPGGSVGRRLLGRVSDAMIKGPLPAVGPGATTSDCVFAMARTRLPLVLVMKDDDLLGTVTERELKRAMEQDAGLDMPVATVMNPLPATVDRDTPLREAQARMREDDLDALVVVESEGQVCGLMVHPTGG